MNTPQIEDIYPLSPMQEGFLFHAVYDPESRAYCVQTTFRWEGAFQRQAFEESWQFLTRRYAALRTAFIYETQARPLQVVMRERPLNVDFTDLRSAPEADRQPRIEAYRRQDLERGFDLQRDPLLRIMVFQCADQRYDFVVTYHHIIVDGWCFGILQQEFLQVYQALSAGHSPAQPPVRPYRDYIRWLEQQDRSAARAYWERYLAEYRQAAGLPNWTVRTPLATYRVQETFFELPPTLTRQIEALVTSQHVTLNTAIQTLWGILLARYNNIEDVVFGTIVSGRPTALDGMEGMVGVFINATPMRVRYNPAAPFATMLRQVQQDWLESERYHYFPLAEIQTLTPLGRDLFDHLLIFENYPFHMNPPSQELIDRSPYRIDLVSDREQTHYNFTLVIIPGAPLSFKISFNRHVYPEDLVARIVTHFQTLAQQAVQSPDRPLGQIPFLSEEERQQWFAWSQTAQTNPAETCLHRLFEAQVEQHPEKLAVVCQDHQITYHELNTRANQLAHLLQQAGVGPDVLVGICLERSIDLLVGIFAILKAGGAYVPLDPAYPDQRLAFILHDAGIRVLITQTAILSRLPAHPAITFCLDRDAIVAKQQPPNNPTSDVTAEHLMYVLYTSGSTGRPKGVLIEHRNVCALLFGYEQLAPASFPLVGTSLTPISFDVAVWEIFAVLCFGGTLHLLPHNLAADPEELTAYFYRQQVTSAYLPPALLGGVADQLEQQPGPIPLQRILVGVEPIKQGVLQRFRNLAAELSIINGYGPTETTICATFFPFCQALEPERRTPIGRAVPGYEIYLVNASGQPVPIGVPGEILIAGRGPGRGYLNRPDLTADRFICHPFNAVPGARMFKTGDLGRYLPDGNLEFLGRLDDQVKVRGFRVELGEVEAALAIHPAIRECAVTLREVMPGESQLVAYFVLQSGQTTSPDNLRQHLQKYLPEYMLPTAFVKLENLPLTPHGKVDRHALPAPAEPTRPAGSSSKLPRDTLEAQVLHIWQEVLQVGHISIYDSFFDLGGHSLKAMQIVSRIHKTCGVKLRLQDLFAAPTIAGIARVIKQTGQSAYIGIPPAAPQDDYPLSYAQQRLWILHRMGTAASVAYNMPKALLIEETVDVSALRQAFATVIDRHEALRTAFVEVAGEPRQQILPDAPFHIATLDLRTTEDADERVQAALNHEAIAPFDLTQPPLFRATLITLADTRAIFALTMHHIIGDGWAVNVLTREVLTLYDAYHRKQPNPLPPLRIQYKDFAVWQRARDFSADEAYWLTHLTGMPEQIALPYDFSPASERDFQGHTLLKAFDAELSQTLKRIATAHQTTLSNVILTIFTVVLFQVSRQSDLCVGLAIANRQHPDLEHLIGFFVNILPIRIPVEASMEFEDLLAHVIQTTYAAFEHQDYPFDLLIQKLNPQRFTNRQPIVNVVYGFQNFADVHIEVASAPILHDRTQGKTVHPVEIAFETSKFDLTLFVVDTGQELELYIEYDTTLFAEPTITRILAALERFARMAADQAANG